MKLDLSLYIHIPFCKSKCHYCDFLSFACGDGEQRKYVEALIGEIRSYGERCEDYVVRSVFLGGGTPSILRSEELGKILGAVREAFCLSEDAEVTVEANPGTLSREKIRVLVASGVNRVSMGLQSCQNEFLKRLGRIHTWEVFLESYELLREMGISNINVDLMFGLPDQTLDDVRKDLEMILSLSPEHLSCYGLIVEEGTHFYRLYERDELPVADDELEREMYWLIHERLTAEGYEHYEISNYGKAGRACYHNNVYWTGKPYIGLGLGASSYFENVRYKNTDDMENYIAAQGDIELLKEEIEEITPERAIEEAMFLGLRLLNGVEKEAFHKRFGKPIDEYYGSVIQELVQNGLLMEDATKIWLTPRGIDVSNQVFTSFLL